MKAFVLGHYVGERDEACCSEKNLFIMLQSRAAGTLHSMYVFLLGHNGRLGSEFM